jgi:hypothetical protein
MISLWICTGASCFCQPFTGGGFQTGKNKMVGRVCCRQDRRAFFRLEKTKSSEDVPVLEGLALLHRPLNGSALH